MGLSDPEPFIQLAFHLAPGCDVLALKSTFAQNKTSVESTFI